MNIKEELIKLLNSKGADLIGFCSLEQLPFIKKFLSGISIAVSLDPKIISTIEDGPNWNYYHEYIKVNDKLNSLSKIASDFLISYGFKTDYWGSTDDRILDDKLSTELPHKTLATLSGLGWIGKCALLITKEYGSAVRLTSILTNMSIDITKKPFEKSFCKDCEECVLKCPGKAPNGKEWYKGLYRDDFFNPKKCREAARKLAKVKIGKEYSFCGICIAVCPYTKNYIKEMS